MGEKNIIQSWEKINSRFASVFVVWIFAVFPLVFRNFYFDILKAKYQFYYVSVLLLIGMIVIVAFVFLCRDMRAYGGEHIKGIFCSFRPGSLKAADWSMLAFVLMATVSTLQSEYVYESFWGNEGRYCGLFLILLYGMSYVVITGYFRFKRWYLDVFLLGGILAGILGILQYFKFNPLGMKTGLADNKQWIFTSTIGNVNTYTSYLALLLGVGVVLFAKEENKIKRSYYLFSVIVTMISLVLGISDNSYITLAVILGLLPLYLFTDLKGVKRYTLLVSILFAIFLMVGWVNHTFPDRVIGIEGLFNVITRFSLLPLISCVVWAGTAVLYFGDSRTGAGTTKETGSLRMAWLILVIVAAVFMFVILIDANVFGNVERYGSLKNYLIFDDEWGTHRGYIWRIALESYRDFPLHHKIFGYGPETFGIMTVQNYLQEMGMRYYEKFDNAHNEYIHYLFTMGFAGLTAYLALLVFSLKEMLRNACKTPAIMGIFFAVVCYCVQAAVNLSTPIVTPIMLTLLMTGIAISRRGENITYEEKETEPGMDIADNGGKEGT